MSFYKSYASQNSLHREWTARINKALSKDDSPIPRDSIINSWYAEENKLVYKLDLQKVDSRAFDWVKKNIGSECALCYENKEWAGKTRVSYEIEWTLQIIITHSWYQETRPYLMYKSATRRELYLIILAVVLLLVFSTLLVRHWTGRAHPWRDMVEEISFWLESIVKYVR